MKSVKPFGQHQSRASFLLLLSVFVLLAAACGDKAKDRVKNEQARPGRDRELYEDAVKKLDKGRYDESRLLFNVVITTYPDSEWLPMAKLAIADSFYLEGGSTNLEQAIGGYKDFSQYFPTHPLNCKVKLKIAEAYMRQMNAYNRDWTKGKQAEFQLQATKQTCLDSPLRPYVEDRLAKVQQILGLHELDIADFYFDNRKAYKAAEGRYREVVEKYPSFTYRDVALFRLGQSLLEQEQPEEAAQYFTTLARDIPNSEYTPKAKEYLEKLGKPIPAPANDNPAPERYGRASRLALIMGMNGLDPNKDGVIFTRKGKEDDVNTADLQKPVDATGAGVKATVATSRPAFQPSTDSSNTAATTNGDNGATNGATSGSQTRTRTVNEPATTPATDNKTDKKKKEKKGLFGRIFK